MDYVLERVQWIQFPEVMTAYPDGCAAEGAYASARWPGAIEKLRTVAWHGSAAIRTLRERREIHLDRMCAGKWGSHQDGILVLTQISRAAVDHSRIDLTRTGRQDLDYTAKLIVLTVGTDDLHRKRMSLRRGRIVIVGNVPVELG